MAIHVFEGYGVVIRRRLGGGRFIAVVAPDDPASVVSLHGRLAITKRKRDAQRMRRDLAQFDATVEPVRVTISRRKSVR